MREPLQSAPAGASPTDGSARLLYATLPAEVHVFWRTVEKGIRQAAEAHGYEALIRSAHDDQQFTENKNLENDLTRFLIKNGARVIIVAPSPALDPSLTPPDASYVFAGRGPDKFTLPYREGSLVAIDSFQAGRKAALALRGVLPPGARVGAFEITGTMVTIAERVAGFVTEAKAQGYEVVFDGLPLGDGIREPETLALNVLQQHPDVQAVFTPNEMTTFAVTRALTHLAPQRRPLHVGLDFRAEFAEPLRQGTLFAVVVQDPFLIGITTAETALKVEQGLPVPKMTEVDTFVVTQQNLQDPEIQARLKYYLE